MMIGVEKGRFRFARSLVAQMVKCLPTMRETGVQSLGQEDLLEKETATHSRTLAWKIPWTEEPGGLQSMGSQSQTQPSDFTGFPLKDFLCDHCHKHVHQHQQELLKRS